MRFTTDQGNILGPLYLTKRERTLVGRLTALEAPYSKH